MKNFLKILLILMISGCYSTQRAEKQLNKAQVNFPEVVAKKSAIWYPCTYKVITDSFNLIKWKFQIDSIIKTDTIILHEITLKECDGLEAIKKANDKLKTDINNKNVLISNLTRLINQVPMVYKTVIVKDSAASYVLETNLKDKVTELSKSKDDRTKGMRITILLIIALAISLLINLLQWKFRKIA